MSRGEVVWGQEFRMRSGKWDYMWRKGAVSQMEKKNDVFLDQHELLEKLVKTFIFKREALEWLWGGDWKKEWLIMLKKKAQNIRSTGFPEAVIQQLALSRSGVWVPCASTCRTLAKDYHVLGPFASQCSQWSMNRSDMCHFRPGL